MARPGETSAQRAPPSRFSAFLFPLLFVYRLKVAPLLAWSSEGSPTKIDYRQKGALILTSGPSL